MSTAALGLTILLLGVLVHQSPAAMAEGVTEHVTVAQSGDATCVGTLPPGSYVNVVVPANASCTLDQTHRIFADLRVEPGAVLTATGVYVEANLVSFGCIYATDIRVGGAAQLNPSGGGAPCYITGSSIGASLELRGGLGGFRLEQTMVGGGVDLLDVDPSGTYGPDVLANTIVGGAVRSINRFGINVANTTIGGGLVCSNYGPSNLAGGNVIGGQTSCP